MLVLAAWLVGAVAFPIDDVAKSDVTLAKGDLALATFDGEKASSRKFETVNDPVMGGASTSTFKVHAAEKVGVWAGEVRVVKSLGAPGFCTMRTAGEKKFPDCSRTKSIGLKTTGGTGLPYTDFTLQIGVSGVTTPQTMYTAQFTSKYCCGNDCLVPWHAFKMQFQGKPIDGPPLAGKLLGEMSTIGLGTAGTAGKFTLNIAAFYATTNATNIGANCTRAVVEA